MWYVLFPHCNSSLPLLCCKAVLWRNLGQFAVSVLSHPPTDHLALAHNLIWKKRTFFTGEYTVSFTMHYTKTKKIRYPILSISIYDLFKINAFIQNWPLLPSLVLSMKGPNFLNTCRFIPIFRKFEQVVTDIRKVSHWTHIFFLLLPNLIFKYTGSLNFWLKHIIILLSYNFN